MRREKPQKAGEAAKKTPLGQVPQGGKGLEDRKTQTGFVERGNRLPPRWAGDRPALARRGLGLVGADHDTAADLVEVLLQADALAGIQQDRAHEIGVNAAVLVAGLCQRHEHGDIGGVVEL